MTFLSKDLSIMTYANGFTLWHYITTDTTRVVEEVKYFNNGSDMLKVGDMIMINISNEDAPGASIYWVKSINNDDVRIANLNSKKASKPIDASNHITDLTFKYELPSGTEIDVYAIIARDEIDGVFVDTIETTIDGKNIDLAGLYFLRYDCKDPIDLLDYLSELALEEYDAEQ